MNEYDFLILQPNEFENLTRDLLQKRGGVFIESFTIGRDGGIDLRFSSPKGQKQVIIQAKRYKDYAKLKSVLKDEVAKVRKLNPDRYILSTSVGLTPENKTEIMTMFSPYIKATKDILGRNDLNNLLGEYSEVEKQYYKLWLGSTAVLDDILNKRINNWSEMTLEEARKDVSLYVMNDSFERALTILKENRYVIISGIPGIGKTTLSRMLAYQILANGYDEFIKVNSMMMEEENNFPGYRFPDVRSVTSPASGTKVVTPGLQMLDYNGHVHNSEYINLAGEILPESETAEEVEVVYRTQILPGKPVRLEWIREEETQKVAIRDPDDGGLHALVMIRS